MAKKDKFKMVSIFGADERRDDSEENAILKNGGHV